MDGSKQSPICAGVIWGVVIVWAQSAMLCLTPTLSSYPHLGGTLTVSSGRKVSSSLPEISTSAEHRLQAQEAQERQ